MGCCGDREKDAFVRDEQKWDYVVCSPAFFSRIHADVKKNLDDFKSSSCLTPFAYGYLWVCLFISISVYCVDTFTAVNLLAFDRWAGKIKPAIPLTISRWIFAGCIILSFILLFYRWLRAVRVMKKGGVAQCYLDPLAVRIQSIRSGKARGWKRFLVFAELTKSKKGADYIALFSYFSFEAWLRICFAEGPRQVLNAITLYTVMRLNLLPQGQHAATDGHTPIIQFFVNVGILASSNVLQAVILFGMLWTLVIWVISALSLFISLVLYLVFLWHHIPSSDGGLKSYCRRKINRRLDRIVKAKVDSAFKKENELRQRNLAQDGQDFKRQPTLPDIGAAGVEDPLPPLSRQTTMTTLPEYSSRPSTSRVSDDSLASLPMKGGPGRPPLPSRGMTRSSDASWSSYTSNAPLMNGAGDMGRSVSEPLQTPSSASPSPWDSRPPPTRSMTGLAQPGRPYSPGPGARSGSSSGRDTPGTYRMEPMSRNGNSGPPRIVGRTAPDSDYSAQRSPSGQQNPYFPPIPTSSSGASFTRSPDNMDDGRSPMSTVNPYFPPIPNQTGRNSPAPSLRGPPPPGSYGRNSPAPSYQSQNPNPRPYPPMAPPSYGSGRSITPSRQASLPQLQTSVGGGAQASSQYVPFSPSAQSVNSAGPGGAQDRSRSASRLVPAGPYNSYGSESGRGRQPPQPQSAHSAYPPRQASAGFGPQQSRNAHDSVADILDGY